MKAGEPSSNTSSAQLTFASSQAVHSSAKLSTSTARPRARGSARRLALRQLPAFTSCSTPCPLCAGQDRPRAGVVPCRVELLHDRVRQLSVQPRKGSWAHCWLPSAAQHSHATGHSRDGASHGVLQVITRTVQHVSTQAQAQGAIESGRAPETACGMQCRRLCASRAPVRSHR